MHVEGVGIIAKLFKQRKIVSSSDVLIGVVVPVSKTHGEKTSSTVLGTKISSLSELVITSLFKEDPPCLG